MVNILDIIARQALRLRYNWELLVLDGFDLCWLVFGSFHILVILVKTKLKSVRTQQLNF